MDVLDGPRGLLAAPLSFRRAGVSTWRGSVNCWTSGARAAEDSIHAGCAPNNRPGIETTVRDKWKKEVTSQVGEERQSLLPFTN